MSLSLSMAGLESIGPYFKPLLALRAQTKAQQLSKFTVGSVFIHACSKIQWVHSWANQCGPRKVY